MKIGLINNTAMNLPSSQRYYIHRKLRELGYRVNARERTVYIPSNTPPLGRCSQLL